MDTYGTQQPIALLKLLLEKGGMYDRGKELTFKHFRDIGFLAAMGKVSFVNLFMFTFLSIEFQNGDVKKPIFQLLEFSPRNLKEHYELPLTLRNKFNVLVTR